MDDRSRQTIENLERETHLETGIGRIARGECPTGCLNPIACTFCPYGHMLECHYPYTCEEAECSHYQHEMEEE